MVLQIGQRHPAMHATFTEAEPSFSKSYLVALG